MPELYSFMPSRPQINVLYLAPGQEIISPEQLRVLGPETIATGGGTRLAKVSPSMLVKYGTHASPTEAKNMLYVAENTSIPIPRLFAAYAYRPVDKDLDGFGTVYDTYIFMEFIEGEELGKSWARCTYAEKQMISIDLKKHMTELRSLPAANYIGSVHKGPVTDVILEWSTPSKGQIHYACCGLPNNKAKSQVGPYIRGMLDAHKHGIVFTHGDLRPRNIIVKDGHVTAIIDWEMARWYPDY